jgi:hypothetical protein
MVFKYLTVFNVVEKNYLELEDYLTNGRVFVIATTYSYSPTNT